MTSELPSETGPTPISAEERRIEERHAEIKRRWWMLERDFERRRKRRKAQKPSLATLRVCELNKLFFVRYGGRTILPDDDDGRDSLVIMINHLAMLADPRLRIKDWALRWAPWLEHGRLERLMEKTIARPTKWSADGLARRLNLTISERDRLDIKTIGAVDLDKAGRARRRRERDRHAKQVRRRAGGSTPREQSAARTKPWIAAGVSRSKWYADQKAARDDEIVATSGQIRRQYGAISTADELVPSSKPSRENGRQGAGGHPQRPKRLPSDSQSASPAMMSGSAVCPRGRRSRLTEDGLDCARLDRKCASRKG
jgi:hypothetical protein